MIIAATVVTFAVIFAASGKAAPMRLAIRVLAATDNGKGIWKVIEIKVLSTLWAARWVDEKKLAARVKISKARNSASTMTKPGRASLIMGSQFRKARVVNPPGGGKKNV